MSVTRSDYDKLMLPTYAPPPPVFVRGDGSRVWDDGGREYVDFGGGIAVLSLGHCPPPLSAALAAQAETLMHLSNLHVNEQGVRLARLLVENTFAARVFLCNSGAEANEAAIKLARRRGVGIDAEKYHMLCFSGCFHGRVGMAMAATSGAKVREGFGPLTPGFHLTPFNDLAAAQAAMDDRFCAILVEPVQGEGGVNIADQEFLRGLRALADQHKALLMYDEVQSGAGRTGALYAYMHDTVLPDVLTSAKGLGGGFPVAAMLAGEKAATALGVGAHGTTYGGNALAATAAATVLETVLADGFLAGVKARAAVFAERLRRLNEQYKIFGEIRQSGLLIGCDMADGYKAANLTAAALAEGLIVLTAGANAMRLAPALNISDEDIGEGFKRLERVVMKLKII